jgi:benzodiazapine receptor
MLHLQAAERAKDTERAAKGEAMARHNSAIALAVFLVAVSAAAVAGSAFVSASPQRWYSEPSWAPPDWLFGPVWTVLYAMMAVSAWLVWREKGVSGARGSFGLFALQLALNAAWSPVFFGARAPGAAFVVIVLLWCAIIATIIAFGRHSRAAALLLIPYILWVTFAAALNLRIWQLTE